EPHQLALALDADDAHRRKAHGEAQRSGAAAAADIEHPLARLCRDRRRQQHRVDRDTVALLRLAEPQAAAEQPVLARRCGGDAGHAAPSAAASKRRARSKSLSSTIRRRGMAPMLPSMMLVCVSSTTAPIPAAVSRASAQDKRTASLVRKSS